MASVRIIKRQKKRESLVVKYRERRNGLRSCIKSFLFTSGEKLEFQFLLQKLPKDSNFCRLRKRCFITGRGNGVYSTVGLCRNMFRCYAMNGDIPGIRKSSW